MHSTQQAQQVSRYEVHMYESHSACISRGYCIVYKREGNSYESGRISEQYYSIELLYSNLRTVLWMVCMDFLASFCIYLKNTHSWYYCFFALLCIVHLWCYCFCKLINQLSSSITPRLLAPTKPTMATSLSYYWNQLMASAVNQDTGNMVSYCRTSVPPSCLGRQLPRLSHTTKPCWPQGPRALERGQRSEARCSRYLAEVLST